MRYCCFKILLQMYYQFISLYKKIHNMRNHKNRISSALDYCPQRTSRQANIDKICELSKQRNMSKFIVTIEQFNLKASHLKVLKIVYIAINAFDNAAEVVDF